MHERGRNTQSNIWAVSLCIDLGNHVAGREVAGRRCSLASMGETFVQNRDFQGKKLHAGSSRGAALANAIPQLAWIANPDGRANRRGMIIIQSIAAEKAESCGAEHFDAIVVET